MRERRWPQAKTAARRLRPARRPGLASPSFSPIAFVLGTLRTLVLTPWLGPVPAVLLELPLVLMVAWCTAARVLRRWPVAFGGVPALLAMGAVAFALLMMAEAALATLAFGQTLEDWIATLTTPEGRTGLAGQIAFALIPIGHRR